MIAKSKNDIEVFIDVEHLKNHLDPNQSGGTFIFQKLDIAIDKISEWISQITLPPETYKSFWGDPTPPPGLFSIKRVLEFPDVIGWHSLVNVKHVPDETEMKWVIRRGYITKIFPTISPVTCKTVAFVFNRFDQKRLAKKIENDVALGVCKTKEEHQHWKFVQAPTEWVLITTFPGTLAPPQSDKTFWDRHGFATGKIDTNNLSGFNMKKKAKKEVSKSKNNNKPETISAVDKNDSKILHVDTDDTFHAIIKTYEHTQKWIMFADTKSGLILTVHGVLASLIFPQIIILKNATQQKVIDHNILYMVAAFLFGYAIFQLISFLYAVRVFFPRTLNVDYKQTRHVFNYGLAKYFAIDEKEKLWQEMKNLSEEDFKKEYVYQIHTDSHVCAQKYVSLAKSIRLLLVTLAFAIATFISNAIFFQ